MIEVVAGYRVETHSVCCRPQKQHVLSLPDLSVLSMSLCSPDEGLANFFKL